MSSITVSWENWNNCIVNHPDGLRICQCSGPGRTCICTYALCPNNFSSVHPTFAAARPLPVMPSSGICVFCAACEAGNIGAQRKSQIQNACDERDPRGHSSNPSTDGGMELQGCEVTCQGHSASQRLNAGCLLVSQFPPFLPPQVDWRWPAPFPLWRAQERGGGQVPSALGFLTSAMFKLQPVPGVSAARSCIQPVLLVT